MTRRLFGELSALNAAANAVDRAHDIAKRQERRHLLYASGFAAVSLALYVIDVHGPLASAVHGFLFGVSATMMARAAMLHGVWRERHAQAHAAQVAAEALRNQVTDDNDA